MNAFFPQRLAPMTDEDFLRLADCIKTRYGLNLDDKKKLVESRLYNYVLDRGFSSFAEFTSVALAADNETEMANIINRLTTNYTYFMREQEHYDHFRKVFLPNAEKTLRGDQLCIWSAGCSFGHEAYTFAACMEDYFEGRNNNWDRRILATDISHNALLTAKRGSYSEATLDALPKIWKRKYFTEKNGIYTVNERLRSQVVFKCHNLMDPITFKKKFDLIVCRNVMIYFERDTISQLIRRFYDATNEGGYLYIGHAESLPDDCPYVREQAAVYRKLRRDER
ncbi:chemotaxis protein methyltransferase CheR [Ruminococcus sp. YE71]|uniref:CheR family methyltransferase n=1 Tax=unclassified Ruminococcus TaxID=2608920 RepID=UPI00087FDB56|nr:MULTISPECIES: protein-glutamate O-methyltransferase CheR [unclassified Ruminococcus]SDA16177.1 chemotaxis protein methyltransferase CheR [Ruminococcus sp. YE78]SFW24120.1 chemotaxis protein methyltransferase CheR [Ruminococcus sp. YE71]